MTLDRAAFADRSERGKMRVTGPQRAWFLDQILTQAFEDMQPGDARDSALLTVHGRMVAFIEALVTDQAILCHYEAELTGVLPEALARYLLATDAAIEDVTGEYGLVLITGADWRGLAAEKAPGAPQQETSSLGIPAGYVWVQRSEVGGVTSALEGSGILVASEDELEAVRIANGIARWGREMDTRTFPQEADIDGRAVHYEKGCYLGQEAMAKIHFRGKVNRRLAKIQATGALTVGADVVLGDQKVGSITSASNGSALAIVKHDVENGATVNVGDTVATITG